MKKINKEEQEQIFYAVGFKNKIITAVSNGSYEFARNTVKYYRLIGYNAKIMTCEEFDILQKKEQIERMKFLTLTA